MFKYQCDVCDFECNSTTLMQQHKDSRCTVCHTEINIRDKDRYAKKLCDKHDGSKVIKNG